MKTQPDPVFDHMAGVTLTAIKDPMERTRFYRANRDAIGREEARVRAGTPLPAPPSIQNKAEPFPMGLTVRRNGKVVSHIPHRFVTEPSRGLFGTAQ
jgi:hypothetical protein